MRVRALNRPLFDLPSRHPARLFLEAFIKFRKECIGREIGSLGHKSIDQSWISRIDGKKWSFSTCMYTFFSFDVELDGWLSNSPHRTESEARVLANLPAMRALLEEGKEAALNDNNTDIVPMIDQGLVLLDLWEACVRRKLP
jgi:hypothetical protein